MARPSKCANKVRKKNIKTPNQPKSVDYDGKWHEGLVGAFNESTGRGYVMSKDGEWFKVHYSAIVSSDNWKTLRRGTEVKFKTETNLPNVFVTRIKELPQKDV